MMTAVDTELRGSLATLHALAASRALAEDDLAGFRHSATRVLQTQPAWANVTLARPDGEQVQSPAPTVYLARCGRSTNKPFCDGSHARTGWTEESTWGN